MSRSSREQGIQDGASGASNRQDDLRDGEGLINMILPGYTHAIPDRDRDYDDGYACGKAYRESMKK